MDAHEFPIGARLALERATGEGTVRLRAVLQRREDRFLILGPEGNSWGPGVPTAPGSRLIARSDTAHATLVAELELVEQTPAGELVVQAPGLVERFAKRRYHRSAVDLRLAVGGTTCQALDLSGCGLLARCPKEAGIQQRDIVKALLYLESGPAIQLTMYAVRTGDAPFGHRLIGFDFLEIQERDQDRVIGYVLHQERKRLRSMRGM